MARADVALGEVWRVQFGLGVAQVQLRLGILRIGREGEGEGEGRLPGPVQRQQRGAAQLLRACQGGVGREWTQRIQRVPRPVGGKLCPGQGDAPVPVAGPYQQVVDERPDRVSRAAGGQGAFA